MVRRLLLVVLLLSPALISQAPTASALPPPGGVLLRDTVVHNTDVNLRNTDIFGDGETSIAVNPANPNEIVITGFSGGWGGGASAPLFHSLDGGVTWTKRFTITQPPGQPIANGGCPCDQTFDFDRQGNLFGSFLLSDGAGGVADHNVVSGSTDDPTDATHWQWNGNPVQATELSGSQNPDQNWLIVNRDPVNPAIDNTYVAYDNFDVNPVDARVSVSSNVRPPNFTVDNDAGDASTSNGVNPGLRMAGDPTTGRVYVMYQQGSQAGITWRLNRSGDAGATWTLNGDANGMVVGSGTSRQGNVNNMKFGAVNALIGGVNHLTVDPANGDVLVVFGTSSNPVGTAGNHLFVRRITNNGNGTMTAQAPVQITTAENAAMPSIAMTSDGTVGVFYYTFDGNDGMGFPTFSTHFARSLDGGATFTTLLLQAFTAPVGDNGNSRQRIFGDYHQTKAVGQFFYGAYTGGGEQFGHPNTPNSTAELDPIFFTVSSGRGILCPVGLAPTILGTIGPDNLVGTPGDDVIFGFGGNDKIDGRGGNDIICGGDGNDELTGGDGNDQLFGDAGSDKLVGGNGNDYLVGGPDADQASGGPGDDQIDMVDVTAGDQASGGPHTVGDVCAGDPGDTLFPDCSP